MIVYKQVTLDVELHEILSLQEANLPENLSEEEKIAEGFITVKHTFALLKEMNEVCKHTIATIEDKVIGYALSMDYNFGDKIPILKPMLNEIDSIIEQKNSYIIMGQICIAKDYRRKGIFRGLYQAMKRFITTTYAKIITEVDAKNKRSITAHKAIGFKELKRYRADDREWILVDF